MKILKTILFFALPAFLAFFFFSSAQSAFADAHGLYSLYCWLGWACTTWVLFLVANAYLKIFKFFN